MVFKVGAAYARPRSSVNIGPLRHLIERVIKTLTCRVEYFHYTHREELVKGLNKPLHLEKATR
jgi:hypothetical protein